MSTENNTTPAEEPMFDPSTFKKKKKKAVQFYEDPLGADADPTTPAPLDDGPTVHEQIATARASSGSGSTGELSESTNKTAGEADDVDAMFADLKKKKKKKAIPMDLGEDGSGASTPTEGLDESLGIKKKKKKELPTDLGEESGTSTPVAKESAEGDGAIPADDLNFLSGIKKKKKKKALEDFERELGETAAGEDVDGAHLENMNEEELGDDVFASGGEPRAGLGTNEEPWLGSDRDYTYPELLHRFYAQLHAQNPSLLSSAGKKYSIAPPSIHREGNKKTIFANVTEICKRMRRTPEHVIAFMFAEMGTTGSVDGAGRLVIKGRFQQKQVENILRKYIVEYVTCKTCKSPDTALSKENRIFFVECESCGSRRSVNAIKSGFQAQVGRRSKNKTA